MQIVDKKIAEETARLLFSIKAITLSPKKPYRFTSGILSPIYCDNRLAISYPDVRKKIISFYLSVIDKQIGKKNIDYISGTATAAIPHAMLIADSLKKPMVYVEILKGEKNKTKIGGRLRKNKRVVIIEDHISTGGSAVGNILAIKKAGGFVKECIATTTYEMKKAKKALKQSRIKTYCLTTITNILDVAVEDGFLEENEREIVAEWTLDPPNWGKKMGFE